MDKQPTRRRRAARAVAVGVAVAALVAVLGAGQALAAMAPPDERVLERQGRIDHQAAEQGRTDAPARQGPDRAPGRFIRPEPKMEPGPWIDDRPTEPAPAPTAGRPNMAVPAIVAVVVLALGAAASWWLRHRRPRPEPTT
jgi:hypothetical protein